MRGAISAERQQSWLGARPKGRDSGSQPDALGVATRLVAGRLREGVALEPPLKSAGDRRRPRLPINDGELARDLPGPENGPESSR